MGVGTVGDFSSSVEPREARGRFYHVEALEGGFSKLQGVTFPSQRA